MGFNPRTRMGCDTDNVFQADTMRCFNPRTRMGCDVLNPHCHQVRDEFQSTHPHGVRHKVVTLSHLPTKFQSTHPHGVRLSLIGVLKSISRFQSTHPHGVRRRFTKDPWLLWQVSIHAPAWGATIYQDFFRRPEWVSIHAPAWGATHQKI